MKTKQKVLEESKIDDEVVAQRVLRMSSELAHSQI